MPWLLMTVLIGSTEQHITDHGIRYADGKAYAEGTF